MYASLVPVMEILDPEGLPPLIGSNGEPVDVNDPEAYWSYGTVTESGTVYVSGQVGWDEDGNIVGEGDVQTQARQALDNFGKVLDAAGATPADVAKVTAYVTDMDHAFKLADVRNDFFGDHTPASSIVEVDELYVEGLLVEIEGVAAVPR